MAAKHKQDYLIAMKESYLMLWAGLPGPVRQPSFVNHLLDEIILIDEQIRNTGMETTIPFGADLKNGKPELLNKYRRIFIDHRSGTFSETKE